jgi:hypothetical protein
VNCEGLSPCCSSGRTHGTARASYGARRTGRDAVDRVAATERPASGMAYRRLQAPACVFVVVYGLAKLL